MDEIAQPLLPYESRQLVVGDWTLRYLDEGQSDRVILCVHGNPTWSFYWRRVVERFADHYRVIAPDHLGCGRSDKPSRAEFGYTLAAHRDNLIRLIDALDLDKIVLLAHDWGGAIGLSAAVERKQRFRAISLLNTGAFPPPYVPWRIAACRLPLLGTAVIRGLNGFAKAAVTMAMSRRRMPADVATGLLAPYNNWHNRVAIDAFVRDIPLSQKHPTFSALRQLESRLPEFADVPTCLIWGMQDWCFRPECLDRFRRAWPDARVTEIHDAGHYVIEDAPGETLAAFEEFLRALDDG